MNKKLLLQDDGNTQKVKEISMMQDSQKLQMVLGKLSWKILETISEKEMYPLEIARKLVINENGACEGKIVVGSPTPHGPFKTSARDGHYAAHLTFFLGQFAKMPTEFAIKLDVDVTAEKEEKNNLILVGGPGTNLLTQEINEYLPVRFN